MREFGAMLLPFTNKETRRGAHQRLAAQLREAGHVVRADVGDHGRRDRLAELALGFLDDRPHSARAMFMAGPLLCAFSQVVNDHFDRDVDRINEPMRPTAANLLGSRTIWLVALVLGALALGIAFALGQDRRLLGAGAA